MDDPTLGGAPPNRAPGETNMHSIRRTRLDLRPPRWVIVLFGLSTIAGLAALAATLF